MEKTPDGVHCLFYLSCCNLRSISLSLIQSGNALNNQFNLPGNRVMVPLRFCCIHDTSFELVVSRDPFVPFHFRPLEMIVVKIDDLSHHFEHRFVRTNLSKVKLSPLQPLERLLNGGSMQLFGGKQRDCLDAFCVASELDIVLDEALRTRKGECIASDTRRSQLTSANTDSRVSLACRGMLRCSAIASAIATRAER